MGRSRANLQDLTGEVYGDWTVIGFSKLTPRRMRFWSCACICGKTADVYESSLLLNKSTGCGCRRAENRRREWGMAAANQVYLSYKSKARRRRRDFQISFETFLDITKRNCHWCGDPPSNSANDGDKFYGNFIYSGMDRVDNTLGYVKGNIVPCCIDCNRSKRDHTEKRFLDIVKKIYEKHLKLSS